VAFAVVAVGGMLDTGWWAKATVPVALGSLGLCLLGWPEAKIGVALNVAIVVLAAMAAGWFPVAP
jgi:hypothetical protein